MKELFGFNNQWGRPLPYVIFLIVAVASIPSFVINSLADSISCEENILYDDDGNRIAPEDYKSPKFATQEDALKTCHDTFEGAKIASQIMGIGMGGFLFYSLVLKDYNKKERKTAI